MRTVFAFPGCMAEAQNIALALAESDALEAFVTTFAARRDGAVTSLLQRLPAAPARRLARQLARRAIETVPGRLIRCHPTWEVLRIAAVRLGTSPVLADMLWDRMSHSFDALVARRYVPHVNAVQCFEYTALASFERAKREGVARVLHVPSLDNLEFRGVEQREKSAWPELAAEHDPYFDRRFYARYQRRLREIALADVIITNSSLTARSHIAAGACPAKVFVVPLGAPPPIEAVADDAAARHGRPLSVMWAGPLSLRKGGHYLLEAWRVLNAGAQARLDIYGQPQLPQRLRAAVPDTVTFHGSVARAVLFEAYQSADVLAFPTLSDGFGMVATEAMAHGLPVITTDQAGVADLITPGNGLIVPAADARALAGALQWCLDNRASLHAMRHRALDTARRRQWSAFRRDLIAALDSGLRRAGYSPAYQGVA